MAREEVQAREPSMRRRRKSMYDPESFGDFDPRKPYDASFFTPDELSQSPIPPELREEAVKDFRYLRDYERPHVATQDDLGNFPSDDSEDEAPIGLSAPTQVSVLPAVQPTSSQQ